MKTQCIVIIFALACASFGLAGITHETDAAAGTKAPPAAENFDKSNGWNKLDMRLRQAWQDARDAGDMDKAFECLLKTSRRMSADEKAMLGSAGFAHRSVIGTIVTGSVAAGRLPAVADLSFVEAMELAVPLTLKKR